MAAERDNGGIHVELVYASAAALHCVSLQVDEGTTIRGAIGQSGWLEKYSEIDLEKNKVGIFNKLQEPDTLLHNNDRIEIYRPLLLDPKESRRRRAALRKRLAQHT